ncbi:hypothetical protein [Siccirubricoccus phaeus]|uniref:hypothetical protein n=1 Tax=Siccirubricoccus phaeus TaxID=2595053 RepID=UPI0011F2D5D1|nr:hypothetical protein [Siccirubricoccus phaeus]
MSALPPGFVLDPPPTSPVPNGPAMADAIGSLPPGFVLDDVPPGPAAHATPSRFGVNAAEGFRGTLLGEAIERARSGQVAGFAADAALRAADEADAAGSAFGLERSSDASSPYAGIPVARLRELGQQAQQTAQARGQDYREHVLPARRTEEAALPPISGPLEALTALAGQVAGGAASPESLVGPAGARVARQAGETAMRYVGRQAVESGLPNAAVAATADPVVQAGEIERGRRAAYSPADTAFAAALGGLIGTGLPVSVDAARSVRAWLAGRRRVPPEAITPEEVAAAWRDPDVQRVAEANGITDPADPRVALLEPRVDAARAAEAQRAAVAPSVTAADLRTAREAVEAGADPGAVAPPARQPVPDTIALPEGPGVPMRGTPDPNAPGIEAGVQGRARPEGYGALVPTEPQPNRMTPGEIARARAQMEGGNPNAAEPPPRFVAPEGGAPRTPDQVQGDRQAAEAFRMAEAQRARVAPDTRDTQPAPRPEGVSPQTVHLDQGFPVRILGRDDQGFVSVERYDPRTGDAAEGAVPYVVRERELETRQYATNPRQAQDFTARSGSPRNPEMPREAGPGRPQQEPRQTYRATAPDANAEFPGATRPGPAEGEPPPGRSPFPEQPEGSAGRRWSSAEEAERAFQERRAQAEAEAQRAREAGEWNAGQRSTNTPAGQDADGRWRILPGGYVQSDVGGPVRFADQKMAARWILNRGQKLSPDQFFEIAVHPSGEGFTVREAGRNAGAPPGGRAAAGEAGGGPASDTPPRLEGRALPPAPETPADRQAVVAALRRAGVPEEEIRAATPEARRARLDALATADSTRAAASARTNPPAQGEANVGRGAPESNGGGPALYANPLDPAAIRRFIADPAMAGVRKLREFLVTSTALNGTERVARVLLHSKRAGMDWIARRYPDIPEAQQMRDMLATDPGAGRVIAETYQYAYEARHAQMGNRLRNILGKDITAEAEAKIRDELIHARLLSPLARRVRNLLDEQHAYLTTRELRDAGLDMGYVRTRFFPRRYKVDAILAEPEAFRLDAEAFYRRRMGMDADQAKEAAQDWLVRLAGVGPSYAHTPMSARHTKGRTLPAEADTDLARWLDTDLRGALDDYFRSTSRLAEFTRRFGVNGRDADAMFDTMLRKGMAPSDVFLMRKFFQGATGTLNSVGSGPLTAAADWIQTAGTAALLSRAVLSSLVEGLAVGARAGDMWLGAQAFADSWHLVFNSGALPDAWRAAELIGAINSSLTDAAAATAASAETVRGAMPQRIVTGIVRRTGLAGLTERQQIAATRAGQVWISSLLDDVLDSTRRQASAKRLLAELGLDDADARKVGAWLRGNGGVPSTEILLDGGREGALYRAAVGRFVRESVQNAQMVDRPLYAEHPVGRLAYGITSFMFAFTRNVLLRGLKEGTEALTGNGLTIEDRLRLMGPLFGLVTLGMAQFGVNWARDNLLNPRQVDRREAWEKVALALDRTGMFGTASPLVNQVAGMRYQQHPVTLLAGPYLSFYADAAGDIMAALAPHTNSPATNTAEHNAVRSVYRAILAPAATMGLAVAPGGPALATAYGIGMVAGSLPVTARAAADAVVGERSEPGSRAGGGGIREAGGIRGGEGGVRGQAAAGLR